MLEEWRRMSAGSSVLAVLFARTRSDARSIRPPPPDAMATSPGDGGASGGSERPMPLPLPLPPEPMLAEGEDAAPWGESLLCCEPLSDEANNQTLALATRELTDRE